ncbi:MAG: NAD-dependent epimerase/dehydratase family protein, partial [Thermoleophilia bacterium]
MKVLVTGGAGYIGSVIAARLLAAGHAVTVYDDLSRGHRRAVPDGAALVVADIRDSERVAAALAGGDCEAIVHMAALAEVAESVIFPERYHDVNVAGT